jgi:beta-phosphoglucomutase-like phosphatase (HAD superfamily)
MPPDAKQSQNGDDSEFDINGYFGGKVNHSIGDSLDEQLDKTTVAKHEEAQQDAEKSAVDSAKELLKDLKVNTNQSMDASGKTVTSMDISLNETTDSSEQSAPQNAQELRELLEKERENVVMSPGMVQQIKSFKNIRVHTATESFSDRTVTFDTVIFDATN